MGAVDPFPEMPEDSEPDWSELEKLAEEWPLARPFIEAMREEIERMMEALEADPEMIARLRQEALEEARLDVVAWAEEATREAAAIEDRMHSAAEEFLIPAPKRLGPLSRIEKRLGPRRKGGALRRLWGAAKRLRRRG